MTAAIDGLPDALERSRQDERRRALRALLAKPLLGAEHSAFPLVRRHSQWLREWLAAETGWLLQVEADFARLHKRPADLQDATRPARSSVGSAELAFSRRRYALFCLLLADLERGDSQITLGRLGEGLMNAAVDPALEKAGLRFALDNREERRDLVAVVRLLLDLGVLSRVAGDEDAFVQQGAISDVLYDVSRRLLAALLVTSRGPSLVELDGPLPDLDARLVAMTEGFVPDTNEGRHRALRHRLTRRLLDDPVLYWSDLDEEALAYMSSQRTAIGKRIAEATGLVAEIRAEGMAMVDPQADLSDEHMPAEGTEGHATLLLAEYLATRAGGASRTELEAQMREWVNTYQGYWKKSAREPGAERELCEQAIVRLHALRLVALDAGDVTQIKPLPALARFALNQPSLPGAARLELDL